MNKETAIRICIDKIPNVDTIFNDLNKRLQTSVSSNLVDKEKFINLISRHRYSLLGLGISATTITRLLKELLPDKGNMKPCKYLLHINGFKYCHKCDTVKSLNDFNDNSSVVGGKNVYCKICQNTTSAKTQNSRSAKYRASKIERTPKWANLEKITIFYRNCPKDKVVDHIIPLQGELVCGLHVLENLQYLTPKENCSKNNKYIPSLC